MNDGGPAFARASNWQESVPEQSGMSLRDWFAGQALAGFAAKHNHSRADMYSTDAYRAADAMIAERDKEDK